MNVCVIEGRLTKDLIISENGKIATGVIAVDRPFPFNKNPKGKKSVDFLNLRFFGEKYIQRVKKYLAKGVKISVRGIVCKDAWKEGEDWKEYHYIIVQEWELSEHKEDLGFIPDVTNSDLPFD